MVESPEEKALFMEVAGLPEEPSLTDRYVLSFYYINTVFTTVLSIFLSFYYINAVFTTVLSIFLSFYYINTVFTMVLSILFSVLE